MASGPPVAEHVKPETHISQPATRTPHPATRTPQPATRSHPTFTTNAAAVSPAAHPAKSK
jgi:hypothetical protein